MTDDAIGFNGRHSVAVPCVTERVGVGLTQGDPFDEEETRIYDLDFIFNAMAKSLDVVVGMKRGNITGIEKLGGDEYRLCLQWHDKRFSYGSDARDYATITARQLK
jgi:hypothetical protein